MTKIIKILAIFSLVVLTSCARNLDPIKKAEIVNKSQKDIEKIEEIKKNNLNWEENIEIDLYTAIALAIKNNKELRVKLLENALSERQINKVKFEMLPQLAANAGYSGSDYYKASTSATVPGTDIAGTIGSDYSTSSNKDLLNQDIGFTWNALDFGLSYIRAGQNADRYLISEENETKAAHNIVREVIRAYWSSMSADKLLKKYGPLLVDVNLALNDSKKIEELLLSKPMDALLYQKELLDIQRALQTQKQSFIDAKIQLGTLMGLMPNQTYKLVETQDPLTVLDMSIEEMETHALQNRPELIENHYQERISVQQTKAGILSLLPGINFNAAYTSTSNDYVMQQTNNQFGATIGANLLNVFNYGTVKKVNEVNTEIIKEQRLALSMTVLSQIHIANLDYNVALEEFETAERYLDVSKKITEQVKNAQIIARFGQLELIREQASLLVAELRHDIAFTKLQHAIGQIYSSTGIDVTKENMEQYAKKLDVKTYANLIKDNFDTNGKKFIAKISLPIEKQNPVAQNTNDRSIKEFKFDDKTFNLQGYGNVNYSASLENNSPLPSWINFLPSQRKFIINNETKGDIEEIKVKVAAKNINTSIEDTFTFVVDPEIKRIRLAKPQWMKDILIAAKLEKWNEIEILKLRSAKLEKLKKIEEAKRLEAKRLAKIKEAKRLEAERIAKIKEAKRLEAERLKKIEAEKLEKIEAEKLAKIESERLKKIEEAQRLEAERLAKIEDARRLEAERLAKIEEAKRLEAERLAKIEAERLAKIKQIEEAKKLEKAKKFKEEIFFFSKEMNSINEFFNKNSTMNNDSLSSLKDFNLNKQQLSKK